jgi:L-histidine Nalpha-methyltransferase
VSAYAGVPVHRHRGQIIEFGGDFREEMRRLMADLVSHEPNAQGDGRFIGSGHGYWGVAPTLAWRSACTDDLYKVGHVSVEKFPESWESLSSSVAAELPGTYVSLGPGNGEKDVAILDSLVHMGKDARYVGVDMSGEMLRSRPDAHGPLTAVLSDQIRMQGDFSLPAELRRLRTQLNHVVGKDTPILFSLLGNTLANFHHDQELLTSLVQGLMNHREDRFLLEVATSTRIDEDHSRKAASEYRGSERFLDWVTSALTTYTKNLSLDEGTVQFLPSVEPRRALVLKVVFTNTSEEQKKVILANGGVFDFPPGDTIRLELTRKYSPKAVDNLVSKAGLSVCGDPRLTELDDDDDKREFGLELLLAARRAKRTQARAATIRARTGTPAGSDLQF